MQDAIVHDRSMRSLHDHGCRRLRWRAKWLTNTGGKVVFAYDPDKDKVAGDNARWYRGAIVSAPGLQVGESYYVMTYKVNNFSGDTDYSGGSTEGSDSIGNNGSTGSSSSSTTPTTSDTSAEQSQPQQSAVTPVTFIDVSDSAWYKSAVDYVSANGLMTGDSSTTIFNPSGATTCGMLMTILARLEDIDTSGSTPWYQTGMEWAMRSGVSDGTSPEASITREELATMLWRYAGEPAVTGNLTAYPDAASVQDWAATAMTWAVQNGIINGIDGRLDPRGNAIRSQTAAMLTRFCQNIEQ